MFQGLKLKSVWGPWSSDGQSGATVGFKGVTEIIVSMAAGPMGWYSTAEVYEGKKLIAVHPLHMMEVAMPLHETEAGK